MIYKIVSLFRLASLLSEGERATISQDYHHGERKVYNNGKVILTTTKEGRITGEEIRETLKNTSL